MYFFFYISINIFVDPMEGGEAAGLGVTCQKELERTQDYQYVDKIYKIDLYC